MASTKRTALCVYLFLFFHLHGTNSTRFNSSLHLPGYSDDDDEVYYYNFDKPYKGHFDKTYPSDTLERYPADQQHDPFTAAGLTLVRYVIPTTGVLGVCGNVVNLVVWSAQSAFDPTIFFIKAVSVSDMISILSCFLLLIPMDSGAAILMTTMTAFAVAAYSISLSAYTTAAVIFTSSVSIPRAALGDILLAKRQVVLFYLLALVWGLLCWIPATLSLVLAFYGGIFVPLYSVTGGVSLGLPVLVTLLLVVRLIWQLRGQQPHAAREADSRALNRRPITVLCLIVAAVITYVLAMLLGGLYLLYTSANSTPCWCPCRDLLLNGGVFFPLYAATGSVSLGLPVVATMILAIRMMWKRREHRQPDTSREPRFSSFDLSPIAVLCLSITSAVTSTLVVILAGLYFVRTPTFYGLCGYSCQDMLLVIAGVLAVFNASVKVGYYLLFSPLFRGLLRRRCCCHRSPRQDSKSRGTLFNTIAFTAVNVDPV